MGKKKLKKQDRLISKWIEANQGVTVDDLVLAGVGVLGEAARDGRMKSFERARKSGEALAAREIPALDAVLNPDPIEPTVSYRLRGGGWYDVSVKEDVVDRVRGKAAAEARVAELEEQHSA